MNCVTKRGRFQHPLSCRSVLLGELSELVGDVVVVATFRDPEALGIARLSPIILRKHFSALANDLVSTRGLDDRLGCAALIEAGADDVQSSEDGHLITTTFDTLGTVAGELEKALGEAESVNAVWQPVISTEVDEDGAESIMKLIATLEDDDDVQNVFTNFDVDEEILAKLTAA